MKDKNKIVSIFVSVSGLIFLDKIIGFVKQIIVASTFGATIETDIINLSQNAVSDIQYIMAQVLITAFVSIYIHTNQGENRLEKRTQAFAGDSIIAFIYISLGLTLLLFVSSGILARLLAPSYTQELSSQLSGYIRIYSFIILFFSLSCIFKAILSANKNFIPEQLVSFNQSAIIILFTLFLGAVWGAKTLVVSFFLGTVINTIYLGALCRKKISFGAINPFQNPDIKRLFSMMGPLLLGHSLIYVNQMVDRMLVSGLGPGVITSLSYGAVLSNLIATFIITFCSIIFTYITSEISVGKYGSASTIVSVSVRVLTVLFLPITITFYICSHEIVSIVFGHGAFDQSAVASAALSLKGYSIMFVPVVLREIYSRFQYAFQNSKKPMINGSIGIASNILLSIVLCHFWGVFGVALATSLSVAICAVLNMVSARTMTDELKYGFLKLFGVKLLIALSASTGIGMIIYRLSSAWMSIIRLMVVFVSCMIPFMILFGKEVMLSIKTFKGLQESNDDNAFSDSIK